MSGHFNRKSGIRHVYAKTADIGVKINYFSLAPDLLEFAKTNKNFLKISQ
jgi:hypothetical protein